MKTNNRNTNVIDIDYVSLNAPTTLMESYSLMTPRASSGQLNAIVTISYVIVFFMIMLQQGSALRVTDTFKYCQSVSTDRIVDIGGLCNSPRKTVITFLKTKGPIQLNILTKKHQRVNGMGYECKKELILINATTNFFNQKSRSERQIIQKLTKEDCHYMVETKRCEQTTMLCESDKCFATFIPNDQYAWFNTVQLHGYESSVHKKNYSSGYSSKFLIWQND